MGLYGNSINLMQESVFDKNLNEIWVIAYEADQFIFEQENPDTFGFFNEGIKEVAEGIWDKIIELFHKIKVAFKNFLLNINYIKNAKLPKQQSDDLMKCLRVQDARSIGSTSAITNFYKMNVNKDLNREVRYNDIDKKDIARSNYDTTLDDEITKYVADISQSIEACEKLPEYQRILKNEYEQKDMVDIPLGVLYLI